MKFAKKHKTVEAVQWTGSNIDEVREFLLKKASQRYWQNGALINVMTANGEVVAGVGSWFVVDERGLSACSKETFTERYEPLKSKEDPK